MTVSDSVLDDRDAKLRQAHPSTNGMRGSIIQKTSQNYYNTKQGCSIKISQAKCYEHIEDVFIHFARDIQRKLYEDVTSKFTLIH